MTPRQESTTVTRPPAETALEGMVEELRRHTDLHDPLVRAQLSSLRAVLHLRRYEHASCAQERTELLTSARDCARTSATSIAYALGETAPVEAPR
ncbi:hypothetical protein GCM10009759_45320 [Kitasatospora saccharophila]|uniref:ANTAR domain-containing protein n=1 Tax=Kitasatospora saccharophila TaxID=407973 RepID=A0ABN2X7T0_9ACTN